MILYVSIVEIGELATLPESNLHHGHSTSSSPVPLLGIVWGTAIGLALAHWFAFRLAAPAFRGKHHTNLDNQIGAAQLAGAVLVAALSSLPTLLLSDQRARQLTGDIPATLIGLTAYLLARRTGSPRPMAIAYGIGACALGVLLALAKSLFAAH
jgi:hypothetical protein